MNKKTKLETENDGAGRLEYRVRHFVAALLSRIYGVRGGLEPPLGGAYAGYFYPVRYQYWRIMNKLYDWSGLPEKWQQCMRQTNEA